MISVLEIEIHETKAIRYELYINIAGCGTEGAFFDCDSGKPVARTF